MKTRKKREKTGRKWARYGLKRVNKERTGGINWFPAGLRLQTDGAVLQVDRWLISRANFLEQAYTLMSHHAQRKTALQVEFEGPLESGIGSEVHVSFFTDAAALLESFAENVTLTAQSGVPMWIVDSEARGGDGLLRRERAAAQLRSALRQVGEEGALAALAERAAGAEAEARHKQRRQSRRQRGARVGDRDRRHADQHRRLAADIVDDADISDLTSVTIWCERFSVSFGAAELIST